MFFFFLVQTASGDRRAHSGRRFTSAIGLAIEGLFY